MALGFMGGDDIPPAAERKERFMVESDADRLKRERTEYWDWTNRVRTENRSGKKA